MAKQSGQFVIREASPSDWDRVMEVLIEWWGGRDLRGLLPKLFFQHFRSTSFIAEDAGGLVGFLVGFMCPTHRDEAYIHFIGVRPSDRRQGVATALYERFFETARREDRSTVRVITAPVNRDSLAFHGRLGFIVLPADEMQGGLSVARDYDGPGEDRVLMELRL